VPVRRPRGPRVAIINQPQDGVLASDEQRGSVAIVNWELAKRLSKRFDVVLYAPLSKGQPRSERWRGVEIRRIPFVATRVHKLIQLLAGQLRSRRPYFDSRLYYREYFSAIAADLHHSPADIVHLPQQLQFASMIRKAVPAAKIVLHMHQDELALLDEHPLRERLEHVDGIVTVSDWVSRRAAERFPALASRIHTIGNGVDVSRFHPAANRPPMNPIRLLFVGRISPDKGLHVLMAAFDRLVQIRPDVRLDLVGKPGMLPFDVLGLLLRNDAQLSDLGEFYGRSRFSGLLTALRGPRSYLSSLIASLSPAAAERIQFLGTISFDELLRTYQQSHLLVLPSVWNESYGMPVAEAMACGVPVLASDCGGVPELIERGISGQLAVRGDVDSMFEALCALIDNREKLGDMALAARKRAERLTWDHSAERLAHVYDALLEDSPRAIPLRRAENATPACG
jgi:glycosyltransferase involved in cell wall biosynthesis